jgi:hypothetical protein
VIDTAGLDPKATELANRLAAEIREMPEAEIDKLLGMLKHRAKS